MGEALLRFEVMLEEVIDQASDGYHDPPPRDSGAAKLQQFSMRKSRVLSWPGLGEVSEATAAD